MGILSVPLLLGVFFFVLRPSINNDAGVGFEILQSMANGGGFNLLSQPNPADIAQDSSSFIAAWSPAQYMLPGLVQRAGLDLGHAIAAVVAACAILGLWGWGRLYRSWGFPRYVAVTSCCIIALTRHFSNPFYEYNGSDVILFGAAPWGVLLLWKSRRQGRVFRFFVTALVLAILTFAKLSGIILGCALLCGLTALNLAGSEPRWALQSLHWRRVHSTIRWSLPAGLAALIVVVLLYVFWIARGWIAVDRPDLAGFSIAKIYFPLVSAVVSAFSFGDAVGFLFMHPGRKLFEEPDLIYACLLPGCAAVVWYVGRVITSRLADVWVFILATCIPFLVCFWGLFLLDALYLDDRYFRPISLMLLPCLIYAAFEGRSSLFRYLTVGASVAACLYGVASTMQHIISIKERPIGAFGFRHGVATAKLLEQLHSATPSTGGRDAGRVVYVTSPEIGIEVRDGRVIAVVADFEALAAARARKFKGRVGELVVFLPTTFLRNGKADAILRSFVDYDFDKWSRAEVDSHFVRFSQ